MTTCAICVAICVAPHREPLGRNDAMVNVCDECASPPVSRFGPELAYEPGDRMPTMDDARTAKAPLPLAHGGSFDDPMLSREWSNTKKRTPRAGNANRTKRQARKRAALVAKLGGEQ
jgi:hypothetical protein